ncbi:PREDICTED: uncharacterized protein LOC105460109, partial [Wasmannia auropunctata]|uniref:uncharacterized protein LOC105460109 n=1 Tax=Wasmannia auropunctata TaxID=64793 RepID=UPI0005EEFE99
MGEELKKQREIESVCRESELELQLSFTLRPGMDRRRYNPQRTNEVAAVFYTSADGEIPESFVTIRNRKTKILQQGLIDYMQNTANNVNGRIGKIVVLPSTLIGSPRNMLQNYQDAMSIVGKFGKPDLFITMTCNPKWREIVENLLPGQQSSDRPDICARVFNIKKDYLIDLIVRQKFFGEVAAYVYVIEFQKRGLPHVHILITLKHNFKITTTEVVDKYISAEIPDPFKNRVLHKIVMKHMIHGPCGDWCLINGKCSKHYPKSFLEETKIDEDAYPYYRRRDVGHDVAAIRIEPVTEKKLIDHDEIREYIETRYVGPVEACWRILSKKLQDKSHVVMRLPVHLPNEQNVTLDTESVEDAMISAVNQVTMLIDYFALNLRDLEARNYLYIEIPRYYTFKKEKINATCLALGLIEDDEEWNRAMNEAARWMMPKQL